MEVTISIKHDNGEVTEIVKELVSFDDSHIIGSIEAEVSSIKEKFLPLLSEKLIEFHQQEFKGKKIRKKNGSDTIVIYSINGAIQVKNQRYVLEDGSASSYLSQCGQLVNGQYSAKLADFIEEWSDDLGYEKLSKLLTQITGNEILSASGIQSYLVRKAASISQGWVLEGQSTVATIPACESIPIYEQESKEVILIRTADADG